VTTSAGVSMGRAGFAGLRIVIVSSRLSSNHLPRTNLSFAPGRMYMFIYMFFFQ
jgi:hypothetical protein